MHSSKGGIHIYIKRRKIPHNSGILYLANKVPPMFHTQKNGVEIFTLTQWWMTTNLFVVRIWLEIIIQLDSYPRTTRDTLVNTVWVEHQNTTITSQWHENP